jgi:hypothetical protein
MGFFKRKFSQKQSDFVLHQLSRTSRDSIRVSSGLRICEEIVDLRFEDDRFVTHYDHLLAKAAEAFALARKCGWTFESLGLLFEQMAEKIHSELNSQVTQALWISSAISRLARLKAAQRSGRNLQILTRIVIPQFGLFWRLNERQKWSTT